METEKEAAPPVSLPPTGPAVDFFQSDPFIDSKIYTREILNKPKTAC